MRYKKIIGVFLVAAILGVLGFGTAQAASEFRSGDVVSTKKDKTIDGSLYIAGNNVTVEGVVDGDIFCAGQNVTVKATVKGDVLCMGQNVRLEGVVEGDVRLAGQNITLTGEIKRSATVAGQMLTVERSSTVGRDLTAAGTQLSLLGNVKRDAIINSDDVRLEGKVGRDTIQDKFDASSQRTSNGEFSLLATWFYTVVALLLISLILALVFPRQLKQAGERVDTHPLSSFLIGIVASIVVPIIIVLLLITLIGIPLALLLLLAWILVVFLSGPVTGYALGRLLLKGRTGVVGTALVGGLALVTLYFVPLLGIVILLFAPSFGIGAIVSELYLRAGTVNSAAEVKSKNKKKR